MKNLAIKKINTIISLWLIVIVGTLAILGYELDMFGFYIAGTVFLSMLLVSNVVTLINGMINDTQKVEERKTEYTKY